MTILVVGEQAHSRPSQATLSTITAALALGNEIHVLMAGHQIKDAAQACAQVKGVSKVLLADAVCLEHALAENLSRQILSLDTAYTHIFFPATSTGKNVAPRVAAQRDVAQISDVIHITSADTFQRPIYAGRALATVQSSESLKVLTIRTTAFQATIPLGGNAFIEEVPTIHDSGLSTFIKHECNSSEYPDLSTAQIVIAGGRGIGSAENFQLLAQMAKKLNAAIGASRAAVDAGYAPNDWQIGQTGKVIAPRLYIAIAISGAIQHLAGIKDAKTIVAINKDSEAPIFNVADYGLVGDWLQILPKFIDAL